MAAAVAALRLQLLATALMAAAMVGMPLAAQTELQIEAAAVVVVVTGQAG